MALFLVAIGAEQYDLTRYVEGRVDHLSSLLFFAFFLISVLHGVPSHRALVPLTQCRSFMQRFLHMHNMV